MREIIAITDALKSTSMHVLHMNRNWNNILLESYIQTWTVRRTKRERKHQTWTTLRSEQCTAKIFPCFLWHISSIHVLEMHWGVGTVAQRLFVLESQTLNTIKPHLSATYPDYNMCAYDNTRTIYTWTDKVKYCNWPHNSGTSLCLLLICKNVHRRAYDTQGVVLGLWGRCV